MVTKVKTITKDSEDPEQLAVIAAIQHIIRSAETLAEDGKVRDKLAKHLGVKNNAYLSDALSAFIALRLLTNVATNIVMNCGERGSEHVVAMAIAADIVKQVEAAIEIRRSRKPTLEDMIDVRSKAH